ncbi:LamG-like jellyroll fold domain-containing protein [Mucilaginibacter celer]|uniref:T9SS C-terminal target domain-containing protein n=1 Tax=Mucilaginibacter celer TaxID=2305508 RepID=A0A494VM16_9SPHI|nr:LamG-like jellyroll fold domain-containing protein [Mucilaginibacter celer]AYL96317.1 T9SS C-terminal target domain-containing protein [Mucilaginibacter celer]
MKTQLLRVLFAGFLFCLVNAVSAQETSDNATYYYNNFETASANNTTSLGATGVGNATRSSSSITIDASTTSPLNGSVSLRSAVPSPNAIGAIRWDFVGSGTGTIDMTQNDFEWNFIYRNNSSSSPDDPDVMATGNNSWRYWLIANAYAANTMQGFYITHTGTSLSLRYRYDTNSGSGRYNEILNTSMANDQQTYMIKVQRLKDGRWAIFKDVFVTGMTTAKTLVASTTSNTGSSFSTYYYSYLQSTTTSDGRFQWDNFDMYTRVLQFSATGVNGTANNVTQPSYYPNENVIFYGMKITARGNFIVNQFALNTSGAGFEGYFNGTGGLYRSDDSYYSTSSDSYIGSMALTGNAVQNYNISDLLTTSGNTDGTYSVPGYYFVTGTVKSQLNYGNTPYGTITVTSINTFTGNGNSSAISYTGPSSNGNVITFVGQAPPAAPSASAVSRCGAGQVTLTASGGSPSGGTYSWYTAASGGTAVATGASYSPTIVTTKTYYVTYTSGGSESARTAVTATINPIVSSPLTNASISYSFSGNTKDVSGNQNDGVLENTPTLTTDRYGFANSAYSFNGSNQWMSSTTQIAGPQTFTMSLWFNTTTTSGGKLMSFSNGQNVSAQGGYDRHLYMTNSGQLIFGVYNSGYRTITSPLTYNDGNWHHVVVTFGATSGMVMYVDNTSVATSTYYAAETRNGYWKIGYDELSGWPSSPTSPYFSGTIDDVAVYNTELTSSAVSALNDVNQIGAYAPVCAGSPLSIYAPTITGATFTWTPPSGSTVTGNPGVFSSAVAGAYTLTVTGGPGGCSSTATYTPTVNTLPGSNFTATTPVAVNTGSSTVTLTSTYDAAATYTWSFNGGTATGSTQAGYSVSWSTTGTKTISLTVTKGSCSSTTTQTVVVGIAGPSVAGTTLCGAGTATLTVTSPTGATYNWYIDNTTTTPLQSSASASYSPFIGGTTTLYVSYTSGGNTSLRTPVTVTVNPKASSSINSPMLSYPFESGSLTDWSGLSNNGTLQGTTLPTTVADRNGLANGAYSFSGTNASPQYISTTTQYTPLIFSYSVWFKTTTAGGKLIGIGGNQTGSNATQDRNLYMNDAGQLYYGVYNNGTVTINTPSGTAYNDGLWHHVIVTDGPTNGMQIYVDGTLKASTSTYTTPQQISEFWRIGGDSLQGWPSRPSNDYFVGTLDDIAIYNHELSASEITSNDMNLYKFSTMYCANNPLTITAQSWPGSPTYSWVDNANTSLTGTGSPVTFSKATTTNYTLTTTTNGCTQSTAIVTPSMQTYTWTGAAGTTAVGTANNWTNTSTGIAGVAPSLNGTEYIIIPTNGSNVYPVLTAAKSVYTLNIASGAKLDLGSYTLSVGCNIFNSGTLTKGTSAGFNTSAITWNGASPITAQSFTGNSTSGSSDVGNMTVNNTATSGVVTLASGKLDLYNVLTLTSGSLVVSSPATFTLKSVATQTATVAAIPSGLSITGNVSVERYIAGGSSKRGYRLLTSPVNNGSGVFTVNFLKNSAYVTGTTKTAGGFDLSPNANNPSIYFFRENTLVSNTTFSSGNYRGVNNISTAPNYSFDNESGTFTLPAGNGFLFFFRGDRSAGDIAAETVASYVPTGTTFTATGTLNTGNITVKNWYSQTTSLLYSTSSNTGSKTVSGFNLVANPYASTINIEKFNRQASQATSSIYGNGFPNESGTTLSSPLKIWVYNPTTKQYSTYEQKSTAISAADTTTTQNPGISSDGYASNLIASGQGFFIRATATGQTLTFRESAKTNSQPSSAITQAILSSPNRPVIASTSKFAAFAAMPTEQIAQSTPVAGNGGESLLRFRLIKDTVNTDAIVIGLKTDISPAYNEAKDAEDLGGNGAQVSLSAMSSDSVKATIYRSPYPHKVQQVIPLYADATASGAYQLNLSDVSNLPALYQVWLKDSFTKDSVDIKANTLYNFNIDKGNAASFGKDRFKLILRQDPALGLRLVDFTATKVTTGAQTAWQVQNEANYTLFTVQRSTDNGKTWDNISVSKSSGLGGYSYIDPNPANGLNKYRLQLTDVNSDISFSKELPLMYSNTNNNISNSQVMVFPNPATDLINLSIKQTKASSNYNIRLTNSSGILLKNVNITQLYWQNNVSNLTPGTYVIEVIDNKTKSLFGIAKFVKL